MKQIVTDLSGFQLTDEELEQARGGFNPQPDPPARQEISLSALPSNTLILIPPTALTLKGSA
jgi:hypothetical protein